MKQFSDKVAAITGAGSGLGRALALEMARRSCHVALSDVNGPALQETARQCRELGVHATATVVDVADRAAVFRWAAQVVADHGRVNLLFNNAGVSLVANAEDVQPGNFEWIMNVNFWGVVHGTQAFVPHLRTGGDGHVINISSVFGLMAVAGQAAYNASKFAVRGYTEALRQELELDGGGVSATCVHPGGIATNIANASRVECSYAERGAFSAESYQQYANRAIQGTSAESAALQIVQGIQRNARRVLIGRDARLADKLVRLLGGSYPTLVLLYLRRVRARLHAAT